PQYCLTCWLVFAPLDRQRPPRSPLSRLFPPPPPTHPASCLTPPPPRTPPFHPPTSVSPHLPSHPPPPRLPPRPLPRSHQSPPPVYCHAPSLAVPLPTLGWIPSSYSFVLLSSPQRTWH